MKALLDADYSQQIPYASVFQDEEFYRPHAAPLDRPRGAVVRRKA